MLLWMLLALTAFTWTAADESDSYVYVAPEDLASYWVASKKVAPRYPREPQMRGTQGCVSLAFVIESDGTTSHHVALAVSPSMMFTESTIKAARKFRYEPADENIDRQSVLTFETFTFQISYDRDRGTPADQVLLSTTCSEAAVKKLGQLGGG
jgi:TonB family protein